MQLRYKSPAGIQRAVCGGENDSASVARLGPSVKRPVFGRFSRLSLSVRVPAGLSRCWLAAASVGVGVGMAQSSAVRRSGGNVVDSSGSLGVGWNG